VIEIETGIDAKMIQRAYLYALGTMSYSIQSNLAMWHTKNQKSTHCLRSQLVMAEPEPSPKTDRSNHWSSPC
jgi:hypothetical protein